jgi:hypothetical protein
VEALAAGGTRERTTGLSKGGSHATLLNCPPSLIGRRALRGSSAVPFVSFWGWPNGLADLQGRLEWQWEERSAPPNKRMQLTRGGLEAGRGMVTGSRHGVAGPKDQDGGARSSQLIRGVRPLVGWRRGPAA